jgi:hypothetical protein
MIIGLGVQESHTENHANSRHRLPHTCIFTRSLQQPLTGFIRNFMNASLILLSLPPDNA